MLIIFFFFFFFLFFFLFCSLFLFLLNVGLVEDGICLFVCLFLGLLGADDVKVLYNDWPYGVVEGVTHLVVWTKFELETDGEKGELTPEMVEKVQEYVDRTFVRVLGKDKVRWGEVFFL